MGFTSHRGFESRPLRSLASVRRRTDGRYARGEHAPVAQLDRASVYGTEGHRFESCRARYKSRAQQGFSFAVSSTDSEPCPEPTPGSASAAIRPETTTWCSSSTPGAPSTPRRYGAAMTGRWEGP